jgi:hypothetical protein
MQKYLIVAVISLIFSVALFRGVCAQGTPEGAYRAVQAAIAKGDLDEAAKYMTGAKKDELQKMRSKPGYDEAQMIKLLQKMMPGDVKINGQNIKGGHAVLELSGMADNWLKPGTMEANYGRALFAEENGTWKMEKENWSNQPFEKWSAEDKAAFKL